MDAEGRRGLMPRVKGREAVAKFFDTLPKEIEDKLLRGAARAGANVIAEEARSRTWSDDIRDGIKVRTQAADDRVSGKVTVVGQWPRSLAIWAEFGTSPHYISVDDSQRSGRTAARINQLERAGTLVINGKPVGATVYHPGARAEPFMRPALDVSERAAIAAAQAYINARVTPGGIVGIADEGEEA